MAQRRIQSGATMPERMEKHESKSWFSLSFNHKTTLTMGELIPLATKQMYPGELVKLQNEIKMMFAQMYLPIMHQCYFTVDWYFVTYGQLWQAGGATQGWEKFIKQDPMSATPVEWPYFNYARADAIYTNGVLNYMGFNAPPGSGTLILNTEVSALWPVAYAKIWNDYYRNDQIQPDIFVQFGTTLDQGDNSAYVENLLPNLRVKRRNWPRDYYTSATPKPQQGESMLIPSYATDPETGDFIAQKIFRLDGTEYVANANLRVDMNSV